MYILQKKVNVKYNVILNIIKTQRGILLIKENISAFTTVRRTKLKSLHRVNSLQVKI